MWAVAGVMLGLVVVAWLIGLHSGPYAHIVTGVLGLVAASWLLLMAVEGQSDSLLWVLLGVDVAISATVGALTWSGLAGQGSVARPVGSLVGVEGVAVNDLTPEGIVRVRGEHWSVVSVNGKVRAGSVVQVLRADGVRLEVWGEDPDALLFDWTPGLGLNENKERHT
jgi:membrane-bound ClpP family serine protease